jgi:hypothetical protein
MHKEVRKAVERARRAGFTVRELSGHTWGHIECSCGRHIQVFSTGKNPEHGARLINRWIDKHEEHVS